MPNRAVIRRTATLAAMLLLGGCLGANEGVRPATQRGSVLTGFAPTSDVVVNGASYMAGAPRRVAVVGFVVAFQTDLSASASASRLGSAGVARASVRANLSGVDEARMQQITDAAWRDFQERMRSAGVELVDPPATVAGQPSPARGSGIIAFAPTGRAVIGTDTGLPGVSGFSGFDTNSATRVISALPRQDGVTAVAVRYYVDFANAETSGGMFAGRASAEFSPALSVRAGSGISSIGTPRGVGCVGYCPNNIGSINLGQAVFSMDRYGESVRDSSAGAVATSVLGALSGASIGRYEVRADPAEYARIAGGLLGEAQGKVVGALLGAMGATTGS
ncbi:hypothetical protein KTR66_17100 [Roseococcus sp. SDR]|uniref:hypothetical protein n=1 Tax=Roseococcus sp. SDR TaxID=2835532 RepID=UPI001BCD93BA|nr:hypothetical protein [Roseococcus sp. SDR]MBS7791722.1 hypothetical protein [Roseococcus sp. SDR]MBV1847036.1 hypothetical protein [Roseococcus sp. SDR]